jgi:hypothetical protein
MVLLAMLAIPAQGLAQSFVTSENFDNLVLGSNPETGSFMGQNSVSWYYYNCRGDVPLTGKAITLGVGGTTSDLTCYQMPSGIQTISFDMMQVGPGAATVFILVDDNQVGARTTSVQGSVVNSGPITVSTSGGENVKVEFVTAEGGNEVTIDNISWTVALTPDNVETFDNLVASGSFDYGSFTGVNGHEWSYASGMEGIIDGQALTLDAENGSLMCSDIINGIYTLNFDYVQNYAQGVSLEIYVNYNYITTISSDSPNNLMNTGDIYVDIAGDGSGDPMVLEITNYSGGEVRIDNIAWTNQSYSYTEFTGTGNWSEPARWSNGIPTENYYAFIDGHATVDVAATAHYVGVEPQWTLTLGQETLTAATLTIRADATGSGSLIGPSSSLDLGYAFMQWHIESGVAEAWHFLSSPVPNQSLTSYYGPNQFTPTGSYQDGTGYDFYAWGEPTELWLNQKVSANNINSFVPGKGYLVAYEDISADKYFGGYDFNSGEVIIPVTAPGLPGKSSNGIYAGYNLIGNPYPSSIDWKDRTYLNKNALNYDNSGYNMYIWNDAVSNYGAYNDAATGDAGTNSVGRYIPALQGFFVMAQSDGDFVFNDGARVHNTQLNMKSGNEQGFRLSVTAPDYAGKDEILLDFGHEANHGGADKWYSMNATAPSLYVPTAEKDYSIRFLTNIADNQMVPLAFKAGLDGEYSMHADFNTVEFSSVKLMDVLTSTVQDLNSNSTYTFTATTNDDANRFNLVFSTLGISNPEATDGVHVYAYNDILYLETTAKEVALVNVYNLTGQLVMQGKTGGNTLTTLNASALGTGVYVVNVILKEGVVSQKVVIR